MADFVYEDVIAIIGSDEETNVNTIFLITKDGNGGLAFSFPRQTGSVTALTASQMETFLDITAPSEMLDAIRTAWEKKKKESLPQ